ncbi:retrovirus-related pol polyprotein from transposon TNT 1-94 [Tanacetum coccineum]
MPVLRQDLQCLKEVVIYHGQVVSEGTSIEREKTYVTQVRLAKRLTEDSYDNLFDYLHQYKKLVNTYRAKKLEKSHDPLALVAHTGSSSRPPSAYYVTHPPSVVDYDNDYQGDTFQNNYEDPLTSEMMLLARTITQCFYNPTKNHLRTSSNTITKQLCKLTEMMLGTHIELFEVRLQDMLQMFNATIAMRKDEAGVTLTDEQNDFLVVDATRMEEIEELSENICLMARIQPTNINSDAWLSYDSAFLKVVFRSKTCYVQNLEGDDLLTGARESNLYTISILDMSTLSLVCLMSKATSTKSWLWHPKLSHLNFGTIKDLTKHDLVDGLPKLKYNKDHPSSACIMQQFSIARTPQQNGAVERRNHTLVEAALSKAANLDTQCLYSFHWFTRISLGRGNFHRLLHSKLVNNSSKVQQDSI